MALVKFPANFLHLTEEVEEIEVQASTVGELFYLLKKKWPGLEGELESSSVSIDGYIFQEALIEPLGERSEVFFLPRIEGG